MRSSKIIYAITVGDIQAVAEEHVERRLSVEELIKVERRLVDWISWDEAVGRSIEDVVNAEA